MIKGSKIDLVPAKLEDKQKVYEWCFHSETTKSHAGLPGYPDVPIATYEEFYEGYRDYFFTGSNLEGGRQFFIVNNGEPIGCISYSAFHLKPGIAELDIWMNSEINCGRGFGTDAIITLAEYLSKTMNIQELIMRPSIKNVRAIKSYEKAGFKKSDKTPNMYLKAEYLSIHGDGDYGAEGTVTLIKTMEK